MTKSEYILPVLKYGNPILRKPVKDIDDFSSLAEKYDLKKQAQKYYKGPIVVAKDLMKVEI